MIKLMDDAKEGTAGNNYNITLAGSPDEVTAAIIQGEYDIAALPPNLAANLYAKTNGDIKMAVISTLGLLYVLERGDTVSSIADLEGKTVYSSGKGSVPEFAFSFLLGEYGLTPGENVTIEYSTEHTEVASLIASGMADIALLPQPFATSVLKQNSDVRAALSLSDEWTKSGAEGGLTMGCVVINQRFIDEHPEAVDLFMSEYAASVEYVLDESNLGDVAKRVVDWGIIANEAIAAEAIPQCNISFIVNDEMKELSDGFFKVLYEANPQSVGGALPDEGIYYIKK
jgi:NitT/TauT family transport system substrate-binding protein